MGGEGWGSSGSEGGMGVGVKVGWGEGGVG